MEITGGLNTIQYGIGSIKKKDLNRITNSNRYESYHSTFMNTLISEFDYTLPETVKTNFLEMYLIEDGIAAIVKINGDWISARVNILPSEGEKNGITVNGYGKDAMIITSNGIQKKYKNWETNPDIAILFNNSTWSPDIMIDRLAYMECEVDKSMKLNVIYSRLKPILLAKDSTQKKQLEEVLSSIEDAEIKTIVNETLGDYLKTSGDDVTVLNITDVTYSTHIQNLTKFKDDLNRWFYFYCGMESDGSGKLAQQSVDEINRTSDSRFILPMDRLKSRVGDSTYGITKLREVCGVADADVTFSLCWSDNLRDLIHPDEEEEVEDVEEAETEIQEALNETEESEDKEGAEENEQEDNK